MRNHFIFFVATFLTTSIIIFSWFSTKTIISNNSEENLNIIDIGKTAQHYSTNWYPAGTGYLDVLGVTRYPFLKFLTIFHLAGFEPFLIQALSFWIIMNLGVIFMYLLLYEGFELNKLVSTVGSFFYLLNLYSMTQVWKRNVYQSFFPWVYLPLFILLWVKWLEEGKFRWLAIFIASCLLFALAFGHPAYFLTFATTGIALTFIKLWQNRKDKFKSLKVVVRSLIIFFLWILSSIWWLYPLISTSIGGGSSLGAAATSEWEANFNSLTGVSHYFNIFDVSLLRQSWYFGTHMEWYNFYQHPLIFLISIGIFLITVIGLIKSRKLKFWSYLTTLFFLGGFISKGSNFPLGYSFFYWLFHTFPITGAFRNPYEKFGIVWLLSYSVFFAYGLYWIFETIKSKLRYLLLVVVLIFSCVILVYPIWTGSLFPSEHRLIVPSYYSEANKYLMSKSSTRLFHIPFTTEVEKVEYKWGYLGEDPSENIFQSETVSRPKVPIFKDYYELIPTYRDNKNLSRIFGLLGVDHIILHKDIIYPDPTLNHLQTIENLESIIGITKDIEIGELVIYALDKDLFKPIVYVTQLKTVKSLKDGLDKVISGEIDIKKGGFSYENFPLDSPKVDIPKISYTKLANDRYKVKIENATDPFYLILNNTYNEFWQAKIAKDTIEKHFVVNGFANGWSVSKKGTYDIDIVLKIWPWD